MIFLQNFACPQFLHFHILILKCKSVVVIIIFVGDGTVPMKISFGAQEPTSQGHGAGVGKGAEPPFYLVDCNTENLQTVLVYRISVDCNKVGDGTVPMKISFGAQEPTSQGHGAGVGKGAEPPFYLVDCNTEILWTAIPLTCGLQ